MNTKLLLVQCAALGYEVTRAHPVLSNITQLAFSPMQPVFPAVTCTASATMRTALPPRQHGILCNGLFQRDSCKVEFWNQSARLVQGKRIWQQADGSRRHTVGMLFHQQSLGEDADVILSPAPIHKHHGGMVQGCHACPGALEAHLNRSIGRPFDLSRYWGPLAGRASTEWITQATTRVMRDYAPDVLFAYLPHLDYFQQKDGPGLTMQSSAQVRFFARQLAVLLEAADTCGYEVLIWGDYGIVPATRAVCINQALRDAGFFKVRQVSSGRTYPNLYDSLAFAMVDHQVAHIYVRDISMRDAVQRCVASLDGVEAVLPPEELDLTHPRAGELVAIAQKDAWFAYPWWDDPWQAPDYARHVDIHSKIGFDPCELFWGVPFLTTSQNLDKPKGSHGRTDSPAAYAATDRLKQVVSGCKTQLEVARVMQGVINDQIALDCSRLL